MNLPITAVLDDSLAETDDFSVLNNAESAKLQSWLQLAQLPTQGTYVADQQRSNEVAPEVVGHVMLTFGVRHLFRAVLGGNLG